MKQKIFLLLSLLLLTLTAAAQNNVIYYTSSEHQVVTPYNTNFGGAVIESNTYDEALDIGTITFDRELTQIGEYAFRNCTTLQTISLPNSVTSFGRWAFQGSGITSLEIPSKVTSTGYATFENCTNLVSITMGNSVSSFGSYCFKNCSALQSIVIPYAVSIIPSEAFNGCSSLTSIRVERITPPSIESNAFSGVDKSNCTVTVPNKGGALAAYQSHSGWNQFSQIIEEAMSGGQIVPTTVENPFYTENGYPTNAEWEQSSTRLGWGYMYNNSYVYYPIRVVSEVPLLYLAEVGTCNNGTSMQVQIKTRTGETIFDQTFPIANNGFWDRQQFPTYGVQIPALAVGDYDLYVYSHVSGSGGTFNFRNVRLIEDPGNVSLTLDNIEKELNIGESFKLTADIVADNEIDNTVTWTSSNTSVATVDSEGNVTAKSIGTAVITAKFMSYFTASCTVVVNGAYYGSGDNELFFHYYANSSEMPANNVAWRSASDHNWVANEIILTDGANFTCPYNVSATSLTYKRTFKNQNWQPLYVPFNMSYSEWADKADVAQISGVHEYDDGTTLIEFRTVHSGEILPNVPYIIKAKSATDTPQEFVCTNKTLSASPATGGSVWCASTLRRYTLTGTYEAKSNISGSLVLSGGTFYTVTSSDTELKAMRFYLNIAIEDHGYGTTTPSAQAPRRIGLMVDGQATGIEGLTIDGLTNDNSAFNLSGQKVGANYKGIVIVNGKKVLRK